MGDCARCTLARKRRPPRSRRSRLLLWTAIAGLVFGLIGFGEILEDLLRAGRNSLHWHKASGDIVLVKIDDASVREVGAWPWPRRRHADLTDALTKAGAKRIFFNVAALRADRAGPTTAVSPRR